MCHADKTRNLDREMDGKSSFFSGCVRDRENEKSELKAKSACLYAALSIDVRKQAGPGFLSLFIPYVFTLF